MLSAEINELGQSVTSLHRVPKIAELEVLFTRLTNEPERSFQARKSSTSAKASQRYIVLSQMMNH